MYTILSKFWQDSQSKQRHVALSSPDLAALIPWVMFLWMLERPGTHESDRSAALSRHTHTHSMAEVMNSSGSVGEKKNNELMMTHRSNMLPSAISHTWTHTKSHISYRTKNLIWAIVHKSSSWKANLLCIASASIQIPFFLYLFHCPSYLYTHRHTKLPTRIKAYINSRGADTMNPVHTSNPTSGLSAVQQDHVICTHQQSLHKGYCNDNAGVNGTPMCLSLSIHSSQWFSRKVREGICEELPFIRYELWAWDVSTKHNRWIWLFLFPKKWFQVDPFHLLTHKII